MSFNVLILVEDFRHDAHIVQPVISRWLDEVGKSRATVRVCTDPNFGGVNNLLQAERIRNEVVARYPTVHLFVVLADRDGDPKRLPALHRLRDAVCSSLHRQQRILVEVARQEVEIFLLAGLKSLPGDPSWQKVRTDAAVKDSTFSAVVRARNTGGWPAQGRKELMREAMTNWPAIRQRCKEEFASLTRQLKAEP